MWKGEFHARFSTHKHRVIVVSARRSDPPFPTSFYINHLTRFEVALFCITQRRWPFRLSPFHGVPDRSLVINVLSQNLGRKTQRFDLVVSLELYESTKVNVTKFCVADDDWHLPLTSELVELFFTIGKWDFFFMEILLWHLFQKPSFIPFLKLTFKLLTRRILVGDDSPLVGKSVKLYPEYSPKVK